MIFRVWKLFSIVFFFNNICSDVYYKFFPIYFVSGFGWKSGGIWLFQHQLNSALWYIHSFFSIDLFLSNEGITTIIINFINLIIFLTLLVIYSVVFFEKLNHRKTYVLIQGIYCSSIRKHEISQTSLEDIRIYVSQEIINKISEQHPRRGVGRYTKLVYR